MNNKMTNKTIAIIGGGPVGIFASYACGMLGMPTVIFENREKLGGQCSALYPDKMIYDIPGIPSITAEKLINNLEQQANAFNPEFHFNQNIRAIDTTESCVIVNDMEFSACIIASGAGACTPIKLAFENAQKFEEKNIFYNTIQSTERFKNKKVAILGGGNSAIDTALHLSNISAEIHIIHRRDVFTAFPASMNEIKSQNNITLHKSKIISGIIENNDQFTGLNMKTKDGIENLDVDFAIACYGLRSDSSALKNFDVEFDKNKIVVNPNTCQTNKERIYAVGDIVLSHTKTKLFSILSGFHECTLAANNIFDKYFKDPNQKQQNIHSSDLNIML